MRKQYLYSTLSLILLILQIVTAEDCENIPLDRCMDYYPRCNKLEFTSCCGNRKSFCLNDRRGNGCPQDLSCGRNPHTGEIYELWSSCKPDNFIPYYPPNATCESLRCEARGLTCEWVDHQPCSGTSCCQRYPTCKGISPTSTTTTTPNLCSLVLCQEGAHCILVNGRPTCIQNQPVTCANILCIKDTHCIMVNGQPTCIPNQKPPPVTCANILCIKDTHCIMVNGQPTCVPNKNQCDSKNCRPGTQCVIVNGHAQCIATQPDNQCNLNCGANRKCILVNGHPTCISVNPPTPPPNDLCDLVECEPGAKCIMENGRPKCIKHQQPTSCDDIKCFGDRPKCILLNGVPTCIALTPPPTRCTLPCPQGQKCKILADGTQKCVDTIPKPPQLTCEKIDCPPGFVCQVLSNSVTCVPEFNTGITSGGGSSTPSCDQILCKEGACVMRDDCPQCVHNLTICDEVICPNDYRCVVTDIGAKCFPRLKPPVPTPRECRGMTCPEAMFCIAINGHPQCIFADPPIRPTGSGPCKSVQCPKGMACNNVHGEAMCTYVTDKVQCRGVECPSGMQCIVVNYEPMCSYVITGGTGTISGSPTGASGLFGCTSSSQCPHGQSCIDVNGLHQCVFIPSKSQCGSVMCLAPQFCERIDGVDQCVIESTTDQCRHMNCPSPQVCAVKDGKAGCYLIPDEQAGACATILCHAPSICVEFNEEPYCRYPVGGSKYIMQVPSPRNKIPMSVYSKPSQCESAACELWNATCVMVDGSAFCARKGEGQFSDVNSPHCPLINCPADTTCKEHQGIPYCIKKDPCKNFSCPQGRECYVNDNNVPYCAKSGSKDCNTINCSRGFSCYVNSCYKECDEKDASNCQRNTKCLIINGQKKCVA